MVGVGMLMLAVSWWGAYSLVRVGTLSSWQLNAFSVMTFSGWVAVLAGWYVSEIGRQPWIVYGLLQTRDVVADHPAGMLLTTLLAYLGVYLFLGTAYISTIIYMATKPSRSLLAKVTAANAASAVPTGGQA